MLVSPRIAKGSGFVQARQAHAHTPPTARSPDNLGRSPGGCGMETSAGVEE